MLVPRPPAVASIERISPTVYELARRCVARASWAVAGNHGRVPPQPRALLGIGAHAIFERARRAGLPGETQEEWTRAAAAAFDEKVGVLFTQTHPLLRAKFETVEHIPYFHIYRARTALIAATLAAKASGPGRSKPSGARPTPNARRVPADQQGWADRRAPGRRRCGCRRHRGLQDCEGRGPASG